MLIDGVGVGSSWEELAKDIGDCATEEEGDAVAVVVLHASGRQRLDLKACHHWSWRGGDANYSDTEDHNRHVEQYGKVGISTVISVLN